MKPSRSSWLVGVLGFCSAAACVPATPAHPSYSADVEPILAARCFRCHDGGYPIDPTEPYVAGFAGVNPFNNAAAAQAEAPRIELYIHGHTMQMPPLPAAPLEPWQLQILDDWAADVAAGKIVP